MEVVRREQDLNLYPRHFLCNQVARAAKPSGVEYTPKLPAEQSYVYSFTTCETVGREPVLDSRSRYSAAVRPSRD